jgi:hypothetical protein
LKKGLPRLSLKRLFNINEQGLGGQPSTSYTPYDGRKGHGYGTLDPKFDITYKKGSSYPYTDPPEEYDVEVVDDAFEGDMSTLDKFVRMINRNFVRTDPSNRADRSSFVSNQRIRLPEMRSISTRKGDPEHGSMSPIPFKTLYKNQTGPAIGAPTQANLYTTGPYGPSGHRTGTHYGTSRKPLFLGSQDTDPSDEIMAYTLEDILDPSVEPLKPIIRARITAKNSVE